MRTSVLIVMMTAMMAVVLCGVSGCTGCGLAFRGEFTIEQKVGKNGTVKGKFTVEPKEKKEDPKKQSDKIPPQCKSNGGVVVLDLDPVLISNPGRISIRPVSADGLAQGATLAHHLTDATGRVRAFELNIVSTTVEGTIEDLVWQMLDIPATMRLADSPTTEYSGSLGDLIAYQMNVQGATELEIGGFLSVATNGDGTLIGNVTVSLYGTPQTQTFSVTGFKDWLPTANRLDIRVLHGLPVGQ